MFIDLAWQIPAGAVAVFLIWRFMQLPLRIIDSIRRERKGEYPLTLEGISQQIQKIEDTLGKLQERIEPQSTFDSEGVKDKIFLDYKTFDDSNIGGITRTVVFIFEVTNASPVWINTTGNVKGDLFTAGCRLFGVHWQVICNELEPGKKGNLKIRFPVSERFAKTLAFLPKNESFSAEFSDMLVEFEARDNHQKCTLGYIPIGERYDIPIIDHMAFQKLRNIVKWEEGLGEDGRITK